MNVFNLIINIAEAIGISVIVSTIFKRSKLFILVETFFITLLTTFYNYEYGTVVLFFEIIILTLMIGYLFSKQIRYKFISQILLALIINSFCNLLSLLLISGVTIVSIFNLKNSAAIFSQATILSKVLFLFFSVLVYKLQFKFNDSKVHGIISFLLADIAVIVHLLIDAIVYENITIKMIYLLSFAFILCIILLIAIIYFTNKEYDNNLKLQRYQTQEKMIKNNLAIMESISSKIVDIEHKMKYLLMNIKYSAIRNDVKDIVKIIDENLWTINKTRYFINTNNPYFDNLFAAVIKKFHQKNISPIIVCEVKKGALDRNIYMTSLFVEMIEQIVELSDESNQIQITIHSTANSIIFSVILSGIDENFDHKLSIDYKELKENDIHYSCHYINCSTLEIKFLFFEVNS